MEKNLIINITIEDNSKKATEESKETRSWSQYAKFFDESSSHWTNYSEMNLMFLRQQEVYATELLKKRGHLFLNEVYDMLGLPRSKVGQMVGWIYDPENPDHIGDNYVDFYLYDEKQRNFINGYERTVLLDFNVDGMIIDKIS